jgi:hypothetical protein
MNHHYGASKNQVTRCIDIERRVMLLCTKVISLINDIIESVKKNYPLDGRSRGKLSSYRLLCFCSLIICGNNMRASLLILKDGLDHQIYYIRRNMIEIMVTLYYIDQDENRREQLVTRFFDYGAVNQFNSNKIIMKYSSTLQSALGQQQKEVETRYMDFKKKYTSTKGGRALRTWSGKNLWAMINEINDVELRNKLLHDYEVMNTTNNLYSHLSSQYCNSVLKEEFEKTIDYSMRYIHLHSMLYLSANIIKKYLAHFPKNRIAFRKRYETITETANKIDKETVEMGILSVSS